MIWPNVGAVPLVKSEQSTFVGVIFVMIYAFRVHWAIAPAFLMTIPLLGTLSSVLSRRIKAIQKSMTTASEKYESDALTAYIEGAEPWVLHAEHQDKEAIALLRARADKEDKIGEEQDMSSREMLADMLLELKRPEEALPEYEVALKLNPNRFNSLYGAASSAEMAGKDEKATTYYAQLVKVCAGSNSDRPELGRAKALLAKK